MTFSVAIVGRPNTGKSTLFNRLIGIRKAIVDDEPGVTVDRLYGEVVWRDRTFKVIDTAGLTGLDEKSHLSEDLINQAKFAIEEASVIILLTDGRTGLHEDDRVIANMLRKSNKPVLVAVNKIDDFSKSYLTSEFFSLGFELIHPISGIHGHGVAELLDRVVDLIPDTASIEPLGEAVRIAVVGKPNVGKSTLINRILGENRVKVSNAPGTTKDAVDVEFKRGKKNYILVDTAGVRRKGKIKDRLEKISVMKALESIDACDVAILLLDALEGPTDQDLHLGGYIQRSYKGCIIGLNKWDTLMDKRSGDLRAIMTALKDKFRFLSFAPFIACSALTGKNIDKFFPAVDEIYRQYATRVSTGLLNRAFQDIISKHEPPRKSGVQLKFYYITQPAVKPPTFVVFCNRPEIIHFSYERYLYNQLRTALGLEKTPLKLVFRGRSGGD